MKFIKENSYDILRLYINQMGITIFSLILYFAVSAIENDGTSTIVKALVSIFSTLFYFALIYTATWDYGAKDKIRVDGGRMNSQMYKGVLMGLLANALNILLAALAFLGAAFSKNAFFESMLAISTMILRFTTAMYIGIVQLILGESSMATQTLGFLAMITLAILVTHFAYVMGMKEKKIFSGTQKNKKQ